MDPDAKDLLRKAGSYSYIGIFFGFAILIGYLGGAWLDKRFGTQPWLSLAGLMVGIASGARELYRLVQRGMKDEEQAEGDHPNDHQNDHPNETT